MSKIAILTNIPSPYRVDLFVYLQQHYIQHEFYIIFSAYNEDNRVWNVNTNDCQNIHVLSSKTIKISGYQDTRYIHIPLNVYSKLNEVAPDIVIAAEYNPSALIALLWCKMKGIPFIHWTDGTIYSERNINFIQKISRKVIINNSSCGIASSTRAKEKLRGWGMPDTDIFISFLTVNLQRINDVNTKTAHIPGRILYVGSMIPRKGLDLLINALMLVEEKFELHVVGNGTDEEKEAFIKLAKQGKILSKIKLQGFKEGDDLWKEYQEAQFFVFPSREDCFGLVLVEALNAGLPMIASKYADAVYDVIDNGKNGFIIDPFEAKEFAAVITQCLLNASLLHGNREDILNKFLFRNVCRGFEDAINKVTIGV